MTKTYPKKRKKQPSKGDFRIEILENDQEDALKRGGLTG